jgi:hypothetical protein
MSRIDYFLSFLMTRVAPNFLEIGIAIIVIWLLISGLRRGLRKRKREQDSTEKGNNGIQEQVK